MAKVTFNDELCKGCELCTSVCPKGIITMSNDKINSKGYHIATVVDKEKCSGCACCAIICPDVVIKVEK